MIKSKYAAFCLFVVLFLVFWNLIDYLYTSFITHGVYHFAAGTDLVTPLTVSILSGYLLYLRKGKE